MWQSTHGDLPNSCVAAAEKGSQRKLGYIVLFRHCCVRLYGGRSTELSARNGRWSACSSERVLKIVILVNTLVSRRYIPTADFGQAAS
jgi:hypothetical protein